MESIMEMISIKNVSFVVPVEQARSNRDALLNQLYALYISQPELNKKENRRRYHQWVRVHHPEVCRKVGFSKVLYDSYKPAFKKARLPQDKKFLGMIPNTDYRWYSRVGRVKTQDLPKMISEARDILARYQRANWQDKPKYVVSRYIMGVTKK